MYQSSQVEAAQFITSRNQAAQILWEVSRHWNGTQQSSRPMTVEQALNKLNRAKELTHSGCSIYGKCNHLISEIVHNQRDPIEII